MLFAGIGRDAFLFSLVVLKNSLLIALGRMRLGCGMTVVLLDSQIINPEEEMVHY